MDDVSSEWDLIAIGSGITGMAAALTAAEAGAAVALFEKQPSLGGTSNFFEGMFAVESAMQREKYIMYGRDEAFRGIMEYSHWRADPRLVRSIVDESASTISWLQRQGVRFTTVTINMPDAPRTYHEVAGQGASAIRALAVRAKELGVKIMPASPVKRIIRENDRIAGVVAEQGGEDVRFGAKAVVIGSGGYANNREWVKKYTGFDIEKNLVPAGNVGKTGDGIRMAWEVGAAPEGLGVMELFRVGPMGTDYVMKGHIELIAAQPVLWVDPEGRRFCDESVAFYETSAGNVNARFPQGYTYSLFDDSIKEDLVCNGIDKGQGQDNPPGTRPVRFDEEMRAALENGNRESLVSDSVEGLAEQMGVAPSVLRPTVDEYNGFCSKGHDELFAKSPRYLKALKGPRFYAVKARTISLGTLGGIRINHRMEVIDKGGKAIPGLYAGGYDAGGMWGDSYCIRHSSGLSSAFAANSGRIAGKNALGYMGR
jgi:fumarate reductase flavoprotein subunit